MKSLWKDSEAKKCEDDPLAMRVYTSRLLGASQDLVLHGGGNTSVKIDDLLYVKGSGWDLATIEKEGFPAVNLDVLKQMATREKLSDTQMVIEQKEAMFDKAFPNPSIEAVLHAIIPFKYVDHTHADAVVALTNTPNGKQFIKDLYGENMLIIDYVMPGFILAKKIYEETKDVDWNLLDGIILLNHGVFTFDDNAKASYEKMIDIVTKAEKILEVGMPSLVPFTEDELSFYQEKISHLRGEDVKPFVVEAKEAYYFTTLENIEEIIYNGPLTPEHVIRTKSFPLYVKDDFEKGLKDFEKLYEEYFKKYAKDEIMLDLAPRYAVIKNRGVITFGKDAKENNILKDLVTHTIKAMLKSQTLGGWRSLGQKDIFDMEYWELEQAKLRKKS
jgi:rhamnose utilization protein RhaD (predicted bifunctional aldolase and dehydrogenase)